MTMMVFLGATTTAYAGFLSFFSGGSASGGMNACEKAFLNYSDAKDAKIDFTHSGYHKSVVNEDGTVSSILQGHLSVKDVGRPGGSKLMQQMYNQANSSDEDGWNIWRCESKKESGGYKVMQIYRISGSEADAFVARIKK